MTDPDFDHTVDLCGVPLHSVSLDEAVERVAGMIAARRFGHVATANVDFLRQAGEDPELMRILRTADLVVADGVPLLWMARWQGTPLPERVNGTDLTVRLCELAPDRGWRIGILGGDPGVAQRAARAIADRHGFEVAGVRSPVRKVMDDEVTGGHVADWARELRLDLLFLAIGGGRQELWIDRHRDRLGPCVAIGVGSALDFIAGTRRRAPKMLQQHGLEWAWRLGSEPGRLWRRYIVEDTQVLARYAHSRLVRSGP